MYLIWSLAAEGNVYRNQSGSDGNEAIVLNSMAGAIPTGQKWQDFEVGTEEVEVTSGKGTDKQTETHNNRTRAIPPLKFKYHDLEDSVIFPSLPVGYSGYSELLKYYAKIKSNETSHDDEDNYARNNENYNENDEGDTNNEEISLQNENEDFALHEENNHEDFENILDEYDVSIYDRERRDIYELNDDPLADAQNVTSSPENMTDLSNVTTVPTTTLPTFNADFIDMDVVNIR